MMMTMMMINVLNNFKTKPIVTEATFSSSNTDIYHYVKVDETPIRNYQK